MSLPAQCPAKSALLWRQKADLQLTMHSKRTARTLLQPFQTLTNSVWSAIEKRLRKLEGKILMHACGSQRMTWQ